MADMKQEKCGGTFVIKIYSGKNSTWQGEVTWAERNKKLRFRSALELLKMLDGAVNKEGASEGGGHER